MLQPSPPCSVEDSAPVTTPGAPIADPTPSDEAPAVLRHGRTDVRGVVISMSARDPAGEDARYLEWHGLDHLPEQHRIAEVRGGTRWVSTPACRAARAAGDDRYDAVDHVVAYLFAEPLGAGLDTFFALGADLRGAGRMPVRLPPVELGGYMLTGAAAADRALVGADVLPWRPHRGVLLLVESGPCPAPDALLDVAGVAGCWTFAGSDSLHPRLASTVGLQLTIAYLDDDPPAVAKRSCDALDARWTAGATTPLLVAPFVTVVPWQWDAALP